MRSYRWRGFNKTTSRGTRGEEELADRSLFHLLNLIMEMCRLTDCLDAYAFVPASGETDEQSFSEFF